jgi:hypothetical protein
MVSIMPQPCFIPRKRTPSTHCTAGWMGPRASLDAEARGKILCLYKGSNPSCPVHSQTLYWLSYPAHIYHLTCIEEQMWNIPELFYAHTSIFQVLSWPHCKIRIIEDYVFNPLVVQAIRILTLKLLTILTWLTNHLSVHKCFICAYLRHTQLQDLGNIFSI